MEKNHIFSAASGAQSTQAQEPVKAIESNNNPYEVEEVDLEQFIAHPDEEVPAIYVGSYGAYASGSLRGAWVSIEACADYEEFMMVCRWIHRFEQDPEYMFQDYMGFPGQFYREGSFTEQDFDNVREFAGLDEDEQEAEAFPQYGRLTATISFMSSVMPIAESSTAKKITPSSLPRIAAIMLRCPRTCVITLTSRLSQEIFSWMASLSGMATSSAISH